MAASSGILCSGTHPPGFFSSSVRRVTAAEIAREAGVAPGLLHYYFESKDELLVAVVGLAVVPGPTVTLLGVTVNVTPDGM